MWLRQPMPKVLAILVAVIALSATGCSAPSGENEQAMIGAVPIDFAQIERRDSPNDYLACPEGHCRNAAPDRTSPVFKASMAELRARVDALVSSMFRTRVIAADDTHLVIEQRSSVFGFPDYIDVKLIELGKRDSTLAIYSRSKYGYYDFGVNRHRVETWLRKLDTSDE